MDRLIVTAYRDPHVDNSQVFRESLLSDPKTQAQEHTGINDTSLDPGPVPPPVDINQNREDVELNVINSIARTRMMYNDQDKMNIERNAKLNVS